MLEEKCGNCGSVYNGNERFCSRCGQLRADVDEKISGVAAEYIPVIDRPVAEEGINFNGHYSGMNNAEESKSHIVAGIFAIILGAFGAHKFYLGYYKTGVITILIFILFCLTVFLSGIPSLIGICEGIHYLVMSQEDFNLQYVTNEKHWF